jgi:hypothetical protein
VVRAESHHDAFQRLGEAYDAKGREVEALRAAVKWACRALDNMTHAYDLVLKDLR